MSRLTTVLDELVADAPVAAMSWEDVLARAGETRRPTRPRKRLLLVLAVVVALGVAGTAVGIGVNLLTQQERFHAAAADDPQRIGPLVEVASGHDWALIAWKSEYGICVDFAVPGNSPFSCAFPVRGNTAERESGAGPATHAVSGFVSDGGLVGGDGKTTIFGVAAPDVTAVKIELRDGRTVDAPVTDAPRELATNLKFFILRLSLDSSGPSIRNPVVAYDAYGPKGDLIERIVD